jgi:hypothetical protein
MNRSASLRPAGVLFVAAALLAVPDRASAEDRPHFSRGTAQFVSPTDFVGAGHATHLGAYTEVGSVAFSPPDAAGVLQLTGWATYTAANGDELHATFDGQLNGATGAITATLTYVGWTGRFADAGGSAALSGQIQPDGTLVVAVEGTVDY